MHFEECTIAAAALFSLFPVSLSWKIEAQEVDFFLSLSYVWNLNCQENPFGQICFTSSFSRCVSPSMASTQWPVLILFSVITLHIAVFDALTAYAFWSSRERKKKIKNLRMNYTLFFVRKADDIFGGRLWEKVQKMKEAKGRFMTWEPLCKRLCIGKRIKCEWRNAFSSFPLFKNFFYSFQRLLKCSYRWKRLIWFANNSLILSSFQVFVFFF